MGLTLVTAPTVEPVTLDEAKAHLRVVDSADNEVVNRLMRAARQWCENRTGRQFVTATWKYTIDRFQDVVRAPAQFYNQWNWNRGRILGNRLANDWYTIFVPRPNLQRVTGITYVDQDGTTQTLAAANYKVDITTQPGRILPAYGLYWPFSRAEIGAVNITYECGYGTPRTGSEDAAGIAAQSLASAAAVPECIKQAILMLCSTWFDQREAMTYGGKAEEIPYGIEALLAAESYGPYVTVS